VLAPNPRHADFQVTARYDGLRLRSTSFVSRYLDVRKNMKGAKLRDLADASAKDLKVQGKYGTNFQKYWLDATAGAVLCLSEAQIRTPSQGLTRKRTALYQLRHTRSRKEARTSPQFLATIATSDNQ